jgi:uncharacterized protein (TIGR03435 family)
MRLAAFCSLTVFASSLALAEGPVFDAASVRLADPDARPQPSAGGPGTSDPSRFREPHIPMLDLLNIAFDVRSDQIKGPAWLLDFGSRKFYSITATMPPDTTKEQFRQMLQNLLIERFHLVFHHETRNFPGYALVVDKGGPKLKEVKPTQTADPDQDPDLIRKLIGPHGADGFPNLTGPLTFTRMLGEGHKRTRYQEQTMAKFASELGFAIGSSQGKSVAPRVVDKTSLTGTYNFILEYYGDAGPELPAAASDPAGGPNIFAAIQKQLGLRLDKTLDIPLDLVIIESVDKVPTEN